MPYHAHVHTYIHNSTHKHTHTCTHTHSHTAIDQPASNSANVVCRFLPKLGASPPLQVDYDDDENAGKTTISMQHCMAMILRELQTHAITQQRTEPTHYILACPASFSAPQIRALSDAAKIAGLPNVSIATSTACLAYHYSERHGQEAFPPENANPLHILFVDVGHTYSSAAVVQYSSDRKISVLSLESSSEVGGDHFDAILYEHFRAGLAEKHGDAVTRTSKFDYRLRRACEKLKKLLSTVDTARVEAVRLCMCMCEFQCT
jgi:heat shock protein 4